MSGFLGTIFTIFLTAIGKWFTDWITAGQRAAEQQEIGTIKYENAAINAKQQRTEAAKNTMDSLLGLNSTELADRMRRTQSEYKNRREKNT